MNSNTNRFQGLRVAVALLGSVLFGGCALNNAIHYAPAASAFEVCRPPAGENAPETIVGVALSGGGSRAAVFAASGLEALWEHGLLADLSHVSSVSGGSIAGSYFVAGQPSCDQATPEERDACWRGFFDEYQAAMRYNFWGAMKKRQFAKFRGLSSTRFSTSLMEVLDREFLGERTFADLKEQDSAEPKRPVLLVNASSYDEARRFVFSNYCLPMREDGPDAAHGWPANRYDPWSVAGLRAASFSQPGCARAAPGELPLSLAVASSAAFPGVMGPITIEVERGCGDGDVEYLHLGDGGVFDNTGVDTLEEVVLREQVASEGRLRRVLLISLDSGLDEPRDKLTGIRDFWVSYHPSRVLRISQRRGQEYHDMVWDRVAGKMREDGIEFEFIAMHYTDAELDSWPDSCDETGEPGTPETRRRIRERLESIAPSLKIEACEADLLQLAGHAVIHAALDGELVQRLQRQGFAVRDASD